MPQTKKDNLTLLFILPLIVVVCFWVWWMRLDIANEVVVYSDTPEWYLYDYDFDKVFVRARGNTVDYVSNALLTPEEFDNADYIKGNPKNAADYLTTRIRLYVPDGRVYFLTADSLDFAERIYINGELYQEVGVPAASREAMTPQTTAMSFTVVPQDGIIEIVRQASNFVHRESDFKSPFRIGSAETAGRHHNRILNMSTMLVSFGLLLFVVHLVLFLLQQGVRANLYFSLLCLAWSLYTAVTGAQAGIAVFPNLPWVLTFHVEYMSIPICTLLAMLALNAMFKGLVQRAVKYTMIGLLTGLAIFYCVADTLLMSRMVMGGNVLCVALALYLVGRLVWRLRHKENRVPELTIVLTALVIVAYALLRDVLYHKIGAFLPAINANLTEFALPVFILFQMVANFYSTMRQVREAMEQRQLLAVENAALDRVNQMKNELMANLAHELRTPLAVMSVYSQLTVKAVQAGKVGAQTTEDLKLISSEAKRLADMASHVLGVFRNKESMSGMASFRLETVIEQVGRLAAPMLANNKNALALETPDTLPPAYGWAEECTQLLWNLLANANAHMKNGTIHIHVEETAEGKAPMLAVTVKDHGAGISPALLPHVFERHAAGDTGRTGLGLPICKEIVESHGGVITVESAEGVGTTVRFTLPVVESEETQ
ncbi:sensor histidine kinase [Eubacteriales bacterium OttesenSCG-928-A19]|nr:sensor histidine kinase [Eubacteriales bacterium OttesenSCG-928-A19]